MILCSVVMSTEYQLLSYQLNKASRFSFQSQNLMMQTNDEGIRSTNDDASLARLAAVSKHYFPDTFAHLFVKRGLKPSRPPIINRGTFIRQASLNRYIQTFTDKYEAGTCQVVSFGAGSDTRLFLSKDGLWKHYYEIDFPQVCSKKVCVF
jgi:[phosphatase 2A protein]-leucine-carboxy methyltransferase